MCDSDADDGNNSWGNVYVYIYMYIITKARKKRMEKNRAKNRLKLMNKCRLRDKYLNMKFSMTQSVF